MEELARLTEVTLNHVNAKLQKIIVLKPDRENQVIAAGSRTHMENAYRQVLSRLIEIVTLNNVNAKLQKIIVLKPDRENQVIVAGIIIHMENAYRQVLPRLIEIVTLNN